jgi:hypothetical protein
MDPRAFLALANRLFATEINPEGRRSTISRAYYAAFHVAAEFLDGIGHQIPDGPQGHALAYQYLYNCGDDPLKEAAGYLDDLRGQRNTADYKLNNPRIENNGIVRNCIDLAGEIIKSLDNCKGSAKRKQNVTNAVREYKRLTRR